MFYVSYHLLVDVREKYRLADPFDIISIFSVKKISIVIELIINSFLSSRGRLESCGTFTTEFWVTFIPY